MATLIHLENQNDCKTATIYDIIEKTELMEVTMSIYESGQMYLETIYILSQKKSHVRAIDVGEQMGYSKPSVSRALSILKRDDYVSVDDTGGISLTAKGMEVAMYTRHTVLSQLLMRLGVDEKTATEDACKIEHVISEKSFAAIQKYWM